MYHSSSCVYPFQQQDFSSHAEWRLLDDELREECTDKISVELANEDTWKQFHALTNEMIITKTGRRMFPRMELKVRGLKANEKYVMSLDILSCDQCRYKYSQDVWHVIGGGDAQCSLFQRPYVHPASPAFGSYWMSKPICFGKFKLSNAVHDKESFTVLHSMQKYIPRFCIARSCSVTNMLYLKMDSFIHPATEFIAVTAYQNSVITELKIDNNPFAKGFRENGNGKRSKNEKKFSLKTQNNFTKKKCLLKIPKSEEVDEVKHYAVSTKSPLLSLSFMNNLDRLREDGSNNYYLSEWFLSNCFYPNTTIAESLAMRAHPESTTLADASAHLYASNQSLKRKHSTGFSITEILER